MDKVKQSAFWLLALLAPVHGVMVTMVFLILVDFITGLYASYKNRTPISSERISHTISKFFIYNLVILASYFLEKYIVNEVPFLKIIAGFIAITEIKSILENFNKIYRINVLKVLVNIIKKDGVSNLVDTVLKKEGYKKLDDTKDKKI